MNIIPSLLLAFSASLDSLIIGIAYGIKKIKIKLFINIIIAFIVTLGTFISMILGYVLSDFIPMTICNYVGAILLIAVGVWMLYDNLKNNTKSRESCNELMDSLDYEEILIKNKTADFNNSGNIELKEAITLSLALSINNFALGIGASMSGISIPLTTIFTFIFSVLILIVGLKIGNSILSEILGKYSPIFSALIILIMGVIQLF